MGEPFPNEAGWAFFNEDTGMEWSRNHPVESGEVPDALEVVRMTYAMFRSEYGYDDWTDTAAQGEARAIPASTEGEGCSDRT